MVPGLAAGQDDAVALMAPEDEVAPLVSELIQIDTTNYGDGTGPGELAAADYCAERLREVGIAPEVFHTTADQRAGVIARIEGSDATRPALLVHGHLDVVPAPEAGWVYPPLSGLVDAEGMLWGRGAVDMKGMIGMSLAVLRGWARSDRRPRRNIVLLLLPDEEAGCVQGSHWLVRHRPEMLAGISEAIGEVGGFSVTLDGRHRLYPIQRAEKGIAWLSLTATGGAGHGSLVALDNVIADLARAVSRIADHQAPIELTPTLRELLRTVEQVTGEPLDLDDGESLSRRLGAFGRVVQSTSRNTANVTMFNGGYKQNVIPGTASAGVDARFLPGQDARFIADIEQLAGPAINHELVHHDIALEAADASPLVKAMESALLRHDPEAIPVPYVMPGGTDAKALSLLGIRCYGFSPLRLPDGMDFFGMFHGVNERVPVSGLQFGVRVLNDFLLTA